MIPIPGLQLLSLAASVAAPSPWRVPAHWGHFLDWLDRPAADCTRRDALAYVDRLRQTNNPSSVAHHALAASGLRLADPRRAAHRRQPVRQPAPVGTRDRSINATVEQADAMLTAARGDRRRARSSPSWLTPAAVAATRSGHTRDVDLTSGVVRLPVSKTRARVVPLSDRAVVALGRWMRHRHWVPALRSHPSLWSLDDPAQLIRRACRRYSKGTISPHALRRFFATQWLARGGSESPPSLSLSLSLSLSHSSAKQRPR